jgi:hypothetical protein
VTTAANIQRAKSATYLEGLGVTRIVVVDDEAHDYRAATIFAHPPPALKKNTYKKHPDFTDDDGWEAWVTGRLEEAAVDGNPEVGAWHRAALGYKPEMAASPLDILAVVFGEAYVALHPGEWQALDETALDEYACDALVLFDRELKAYGQGGDLAQTFLEGYPHARVAIFTSTVTIGAQEIETAIDMAKDHPVLVASKAHLPDADGMPRFVDELRLTAIARHLFAARDRVLTVAADAHTVALDQIRSMELRLLEDVMIGSSRREGVFEADTLIRVLTIEYLHTFRTRFLEHDGELLNDLLHELEPARSGAPATPIPHTEAHERAQGLMSRERYVESEIINRAGLPLACGDIFIDDGEKLWMLLEQPCDLQLRDGGDTRSAITHTELIRIRGGDVQGRAWRLPRGAGSFAKPHHLVFKERTAVPLDVLELAVFRRDGECAWVIGGTQPAMTPQTPALARRFTSLVEPMETLATARDSVPDGYLLRAGDITGRSSAEELRWPLRRHVRLQDAWAAAALGAAVADRGRPALEHDLAY